MLGRNLVRTASPAHKEIVVFIYDASASVQEHNAAATALRSISRISDVIIASRPGQLA